jgi:hypothetical protein
MPIDFSVRNSAVFPQQLPPGAIKARCIERVELDLSRILAVRDAGHSGSILIKNMLNEEFQELRVLDCKAARVSIRSGDATA